MVPTPKSSQERRRKKYEKTLKNQENLSKINEARISFLRSQYVTPEMYENQQYSSKEIQRRFYKQTPVLELREFINVKVLSVNSPREFFVLKISDEDLADDFHRLIIADYNQNSYPLVLYMVPGTICVAKTYENKWQRCRILKLYENQTSDAFLFDIGRTERVSWSDFRVLIARYVDQRPFAIRCGLINSKSANPIDRFSLKNQQELLDILQKNHDFYIFVNRPCPLISDIFLYYKIKDQFHCVNDIFPKESLSDSSSEGTADNHKELKSNNTSKSSLSIQEINGAKQLDASGESAESIEPITSNKSSQLPKEIRALAKSEESTKMSRLGVTTNSDDRLLENNPVEMNTAKCPENASKSSEKLNPSAVSKSSIEPKSSEEPTPSEEPINISTPQRVVVRYFESIDAVYICFEKHLKTQKYLHFDVQQFARGAINLDPKENNNNYRIDWDVNSYCLARSAIYGSKEWFRGRIVSIHGENCMVFLRDVGATIENKLSELKPISKKLNAIRNLIWKTKLAKVSMNNECKIDVKKFFDTMMESYTDMAISVFDIQSEEWMIILWGIKMIYHAMLPERLEYVNINHEFVKAGIVTSSVSLEAITNKINSQESECDDDHIKLGAFIQERIQEQYTANNSYEYRQVTEKIMEVTDWLPSERVTKKRFAAVPKYVNQKCVIFLLEDSRRMTAEAIEKTLEKHRKANSLVKKEQWKVGEPCFARFADGKFYRATIRRLNLLRNTCVVRFVDYGNCSSCSIFELRVANMFGDIPVLSRQYQLENIQPTKDAGIWPEHVRQYCSNTIIEKQCEVIVTANNLDGPATNGDEVELCTLEIFTADGDLGSALIKLGYAEPINAQSTEDISQASL